MLHYRPLYSYDVFGCGCCAGFLLHMRKLLRFNRLRKQSVHHHHYRHHPTIVVSVIGSDLRTCREAINASLLLLLCCYVTYFETSSHHEDRDDLRVFFLSSQHNEFTLHYVTSVLDRLSSRHLIVKLCKFPIQFSPRISPSWKERCKLSESSSSAVKICILIGYDLGSLFTRISRTRHSQVVNASALCNFVYVFSFFFRDMHSMQGWLLVDV